MYNRTTGNTKISQVDKSCDGKVQHVQESMPFKIDTHNQFEVLNQEALFAYSQKTVS